MKYIDAEKLIATLERQNVDKKVIEPLIRIIDSLQQEQPTCKTCGFYENNCPFIRGKLIPYPNKVCKDYTSSAMKEQEQKPKVKGYGVMRKMEDPHPVDWYMDENGKEHCWGYKFNEPCPWPAEVYIMEAKDDDASDH